MILVGFACLQIFIIITACVLQRQLRRFSTALSQRLLQQNIEMEELESERLRPNISHCGRAETDRTGLLSIKIDLYFISDGALRFNFIRR